LRSRDREGHVAKATTNNKSRSQFEKRYCCRVTNDITIDEPEGVRAYGLKTWRAREREGHVAKAATETTAAVWEALLLCVLRMILLSMTLGA